jgi:hypothetical protein
MTKNKLAQGSETVNGVTAPEQMLSEIVWYAFQRDDLNSNEKMLLVAMGTFFNVVTREAFPGTERLASMTGLSERTVRRSRKVLEEKTIIRKLKQRKNPDGSPGSNLYRLLVPFSNQQGGQTDQRSTFTTITSTDTTGTSSVTETTPFDAKVVSSYLGDSRFARLVRELSLHLADTLIDLGLKESRYRSDASSDPWLHHMGAFVSGTLGIVSSAVQDGGDHLLSEIYREAIRIAPERVDFRTASAELPPPRLLKERADQLVAEARRNVIPPEAASFEEFLSPETVEPSPEKQAEYKARYFAHREKVEERVSPAQAKAKGLETGMARRSSGKRGPSPKTRDEEVEDAEFAAEINEMFEAQGRDEQERLPRNG